MRVNVQRTLARPLVVELLRECLAVVDEVDPPDDLRAAVFAGAVHLTGQNIVTPVPEVPIALADPHGILRPH